MGLESSPDERKLLARFRAEAARLKRLAQECRDTGVFLEDFEEEIGRVRALVHAGTPLQGLERLQELRLELLGRFLLRNPSPVPPAAVESPPAVAPLSREEVAAVNAQIERRLALSLLSLSSSARNRSSDRRTDSPGRDHRRLAAISRRLRDP